MPVISTISSQLSLPNPSPKKPKPAFQNPHLTRYGGNARGCLVAKSNLVLLTSDVWRG
jgi:hypothetical protein